MTGYIKKGKANKHILLLAWLSQLHQGWQVFCQVGTWLLW